MQNKRIEEIRARLPEVETRFTSVQPAASKVRVPDRPGRIVGYGALFDSLSEDLGGFREKIQPGAFKRTLREQPDILCCLNHSPDAIVGRTSAGTARISEDATGLLVQIDPPATQVADDATELIRTKHITGMSFSFRTVDDHWDEVDGEVIRTLRDVDLIEVGPVTFPAYPSTAVKARDIEPASVAKPSRFSTVTPTHAKRGPSARDKELFRRLDVAQAAAKECGRPEASSLEDLELQREAAEEAAIAADERGDIATRDALLGRLTDIKTKIGLITHADAHPGCYRWPPTWA